MTLESLLNSIPDHAKDLKLNLSTLLRQTELTPQQLWGTAVASALASRNVSVISTLTAEASAHLTPEALNAVRIAHSLMGMNNIYYRFLHLAANEKYATIPARLRMNGMRTHGVDHIDFELWCTVVSAINGCGACVASHDKTLREKGVSEETILAAIRLAAVIHGISVALEGEAAEETAKEAATQTVPS